MNDRPRGLGRGLSALLGETSFGHSQPRAAPPAPEVQPEPKPAEPVAFTPVSTHTPEPVAPTSVTPFPTPTPSVPPETAAALPPTVIAKAIAIDLIQRNPNQPRKRFDEADLAELADSIRSRGVLQPILVRPAPGAHGRYEIVAGERRWRAAQRAGLHELPAVVQDLDEVEVLEIGIIENVQRADLNPLEEAQGYQALIDRFGRTQQEIAEVVGKSRPHIANMLRLLGLPDEIQGMVRDGRLSAGHARAILVAPNPVDLARMAIANGLNVREVEKLAAKAKEERDGPRVRAGGDKDADTRALETQIANALGLSVAITHKGEGGGKVEISYRTLEQLDDLCRKLSGG